jgi:hypothetical protein
VSGQHWLTSGAALSVSEGSEREASTRVCADGPLAGPARLVGLNRRGSAGARVGHASARPARPSEERRRGSWPVLPILFFFFKNVNSGSFVYFNKIFVELQKY